MQGGAATAETPAAVGNAATCAADVQTQYGDILAKLSDVEQLLASQRQPEPPEPAQVESPQKVLQILHMVAGVLRTLVQSSKAVPLLVEFSAVCVCSSNVQTSVQMNSLACLDSTTWESHDSLPPPVQFYKGICERARLAQRLALCADQYTRCLELLAVGTTPQTTSSTPPLSELEAHNIDGTWALEDHLSDGAAGLATPPADGGTVIPVRESTPVDTDVGGGAAPVAAAAEPAAAPATTKVQLSTRTPSEFLRKGLCLACQDAIIERGKLLNDVYSDTANKNKALQTKGRLFPQDASERWSGFKLACHIGSVPVMECLGVTDTFNGDEQAKDAALKSAFEEKYAPAWKQAGAMAMNHAFLLLEWFALWYLRYLPTAPQPERRTITGTLNSAKGLELNYSCTNKSCGENGDQLRQLICRWAKDLALENDLRRIVGNARRKAGFTVEEFKLPIWKVPTRFDDATRAIKKKNRVISKSQQRRNYAKRLPVVSSDDEGGVDGGLSDDDGVKKGVGAGSVDSAAGGEVATTPSSSAPGQSGMGRDAIAATDSATGVPRGAEGLANDGDGDSAPMPTVGIQNGGISKRAETTRGTKRARSQSDDERDTDTPPEGEDFRTPEAEYVPELFELRPTSQRDSNARAREAAATHRRIQMEERGRQ